MQVGIVGLPNAGKSTLFNAITQAHAEVASYPFTTVEPNVGIVEIYDERLYKVAEMGQSKVAVPATVRFLDLAGLVKGASKGEGLGNKFLGHIRETDAIAHVVRCFEDEKVSHVDGVIQPKRDIETVNLELCLADLATVEKRLTKDRREAKAQKREVLEGLPILEKIFNHLNEGKMARTLNLTDKEMDALKDLFLLTFKPTIYVANITENDIGNVNNRYVQEVKEVAEAEKAEMMAISAKIESELAELSPDEKEEFLKDYGLDQSGLDKFIHLSYKLLGYITFFTTTENEARAWSIIDGTEAKEAAGKIHTDMEKGFVCAEVIPYSELVKAGSFHNARESGLVRTEGRDYIIVDGDVIHFRFSP